MQITPAALDAVIEALEVKFPSRLPTKPLLHEEFCTLVGNQQVLKYLRDIRESLQ